MKTYPTYKDSGVEWLGEIPEHWEIRRLGSRFKERKIKVSDIDYAALSVTKRGIVPQLDTAAKSKDSDNRKLVKAGDFVINSRSDRKGSSGVSESDGSVSLINIVMEPNDIFDSFCNYFLKSKAFVEENYRIGHGIVADLWTTRYDEMKNIIMAFPPKPEQQAIANFLDETCEKLDTVVAQKEKMIALLKERKQAFIQKAVTRGLNENVPQKDSGVDWIGDIPENWEVKRLGMFGYFSKGGGFSKSDLTEQGVKAILYGDIYTKYNFEVKSAVRTIGIKTAKKARLLKKNELLFTGSGETKEDIGKCVTFQSDEITVAGGDVIIFTPVSNNSKYLSYVMNSELVKAEKAKTAKGEIIIHTYASKLKDIHLPIPPKGEQEKIVNYIDAQSQKIDQAVTQQEQAIVKLKEYKASLIDSCVLGKIKVS